MKTYLLVNNKHFNIMTPWLLDRERTIPTERSLLVGEVSDNFRG
jgi:hypothetical protein